MTDQVRTVMQSIEELPQKEPEAIAKLILEELSWDRTFENTLEQLTALAKVASEEIESGKTSEQNW
jgi:hypothetical protein